MQLQESNDFVNFDCVKSKKIIGMVTIITVVYNCEEFIERCITSVINQIYPHIEFIIIDGDSKDRTLEIINRNIRENMRIISEKDGGIFDAMNKGINLAHGEWIYFLGADDQFKNNHIIQEIFAEGSPDVKIIYGNIIYDNSHEFQSSIGIKMNISNKIHHQSAFYHASLFIEFRYNSLIKIVADYELNYIIYLKKYPFKNVGICISICGSEGVSRSKHELMNYIDLYKIRKKYINFIGNIFWFILGCINLARHFSLKFLRHKR